MQHVVVAGLVVLVHDGLGLVRCDDGEGDIFIRAADAREGGIDRLVVGDRLRLLVEHDRQTGKPRAVKIIREASDRGAVLLPGSATGSASAGDAAGCG